MPPKHPSPEFSEDKPFIVTKSNIALTWPVVASLASILLFGSWQMWDIRQTVKEVAREQWTISYQRQWKYEMDIKNSGKIITPDTDDIIRKLRRD